MLTDAQSAAVVIAAVLAGPACVAGWYWLHPCVREEPVQTTCGGACLTQTVIDGLVYCFAYEPDYPCTQMQCVERKP